MSDYEAASDQRSDPLARFCRIDSDELSSSLHEELSRPNEPLPPEAIDGGGADESDRLPERMRINAFDIACYVFSTFSHISDVVLDVLVAIIHFIEGRHWASFWVSFFVVVPSLLVNFLAAIWWIDDASKQLPNRKINKSITENGAVEQKLTKASQLKMKLGMGTLRFRLMCCLFQLSPVVCYTGVLRHALRYRRAQRNRTDINAAIYIYSKMTAVERDALLLRLVEVFFEALPQLIVQGLVLIEECRIAFHVEDAASRNERVVRWQWSLQLASVSLSLLSASWAVVSQHRTLRVSLPTKDNMGYLALFLQLVWRLCTIASRYLSMILLAMAAPIVWLAGAFVGHFALSLTHIRLLQHIQFHSTFRQLDTVFLFVNGFIHFFTPFNMSEGSTRPRYFVAYMIEFIECYVSLAYCLTLDTFNFSPKFPLAAIAGTLFPVGIAFMIIYYRCFHPRITVAQKKIGKNDN